jgi:hypothetical protein
MNLHFRYPPLRSRLGALLLTLLTLSGTFAQTYVQKTGTDNPFNGLGVSNGFPDLASADLDGDGDIDVIAGGYNGTLQYFKNTGTPTAPAFAEQTGTDNPFNGIDVGFYSALALGDLDADGDLDLLVGGTNKVLLFFRNTGTATAPAFTQETGLAGPFDTVQFLPTDPHPGLGDFDGDGDLDLLVGTSNGSTYYYENKGTPQVPNFQLADAILMGVGTPNVNDVNGDGLLDVTNTTFNFGVRYFQNKGTAQGPDFWDEGNGPFAGLAVGLNPSVTIADLDGDGDGDAIIGERNGGINYFENAVPLQFTQQPTPDSLTVCQGGSASSTVAATGEGTLSYQWYRNQPDEDEPVGGQNTATLSLSNVQPADGGSYYCRVSGGEVVVWSDAFVLAVTPAAFDQQPQVSGAPLCAGQAVRVEFSGTCLGVLMAQLSDASGSFANPVSLGSVVLGSNQVVIPPSTPFGTGYRIRVVSQSPALTSPASEPFRVNTLGQVAVALYPATPGKLCLGQELPVTFSTTGACPFPVENVFTVQLSSSAGSFANPLTLGTAQPGTTSFALPANLPAGTGYRVRIVSSLPATTSQPSAPFELRYPNLSSLTPGVGGVPPGGICRGNQVTLNFILPAGSCAFPSDNQFTAQLSSASGSFANPVSLGVVQAGVPNALTIPVGSAAGTGYRIRVVSSAPASTSLASVPFRVNACVSRMSVEAAELVIAPNPVRGGNAFPGEIRVRVSGMDSPAFSLTTSVGRSVVIAMEPNGSGEFILTPKQALTPGVYAVQASEGPTRITRRVLVVE